MQLEIKKSSRHSKITCDFSENLILYWLSKHGFECARIDHIGIDLIARNPHTKDLMGISVKARSRNAGTEKDQVKIDRSDIEKIKTACEAFGCVPYFAIVVDAGTNIRCFVLKMDYLIKLSSNRKELGLGMRQKDLDSYYGDNQFITFEFESKTLRWWNN